MAGPGTFICNANLNRGIKVPVAVTPSGNPKTIISQLSSTDFRRGDTNSLHGNTQCSENHLQFRCIPVNVKPRKVRVFFLRVPKTIEYKLFDNNFA